MTIDTDEIRRRIEEKRNRAIKALEEIEAYLTEVSEEGSVEQTTKRLPVPRMTPVPRRKPSRSGTSIREKVFSIISNDWATVSRICEQTGLDYKQVRGVLHAPVVKDNVEKREAGDVTEYKLKSN